MRKVLIPFTDPAGGERAIRSLLEEERQEALEVELLAIIEAHELATSRRFISAASAEQAAMATASCWMAELIPILQAAHVPYQAHVVVGRPAVEFGLALHRTDVDRIMLPAAAPRWPTASPPVTVVA